MPWLTIQEAASRKRRTTRHIWRLVKKQKLITQADAEGNTLVWFEDEGSPGSIGFEATGHVAIPVVPTSKLTDEAQRRVAIMIQSVALVDDVSAGEEQLALQSGLGAGMQRRFKSQLRTLYALSSSQPLHAVSTHPQLRQALEHIVTRKKREDEGELRSARGLNVVKLSGEYLSVSAFLKSLYSWENHNAVSCYRALLEEARAGRVVADGTGAVVSETELPSDRSVSRWLTAQARSSLAIKRARMRKSEWESKEQVYVSRDPEEYRVGGKLIGDHTELDTIVYRNDGKVAPLWLTAWIDFRTGLLRGWELAYKPNSDTIAIAFKRAVMGFQLVVFAGGEFRPAGIVDGPDVADVDNGKDYRSKYTNQVFGKVDFNDEARKTIQRITNLHYVMKHHPQSKAQQERWFGVIQEITKYLPGYKGAKYQDKPDELQLQMKKGELLTEDQFRKLFEQAVNAYNNRVKRGLDNMSPMEYALTHQQGQRHIDERVLDFLMMRVSQPRKIDRGYVRHLGEQFFSMDLQQHNGERAMLYYDPADCGTVAIYVDGVFVTVAINKTLYGMNERDWLRVIKERARLNKDLGATITEIRQGLTSDEAKAILWNAEVRNVKAVSAELLQKHVPAVVVMTGLEPESGRIKERMQAQKQVEEAEKKSSELKRKKPLLLANIGKLK